ncbi:hypothetical protein I549_3322 [Mycobacterium avium subsp. avium 2285 (R)]|nr:hypothetical protein I549_3322 [Mycobacterium avium subsp. avium 2285 (R)]
MPAVVHPGLSPVSVSTTHGARSANLRGTRPAKVSGGSTMWSSTEISV